MNKVFFLTKDKRFELANVSRYGEVHYLVDKTVFLRPNLTVQKVQDALEDAEFDPSKDYIVLTGPFNDVAVMMFVLGSMTDEVQTLIFDPGVQRYRKRRIIIDE